LDVASLRIFVTKGQWKYFSMNIIGLVLAAAGQVVAANLEDEAQSTSALNMCTAFVRSITGIEFFIESREAWRRGYRTNRFIYFKFCESAVEGMVSMGVQMYAVLYEDNYDIVQFSVICVSIASSVYGFASTVGVEFAEMLMGRGFTCPDDRRQFMSEFQLEFFLVKSFRVCEVLTRSCVIASFCYSFRPWGLFLFIIGDIVCITLCYIAITGDFTLGLMNAIIPSSWLSIPEPFLAPKTYSEGKNKAVVSLLSLQKAVGALLMVASMLVFNRKIVFGEMMEGHRLVILGIGLVGTPIVWLLTLVLVFCVMEKPRLNRQSPEVDGSSAIRTSMPTSQSQASLLCC